VERKNALPRKRAYVVAHFLWKTNRPEFAEGEEKVNF
jgi:hypothetical protein